jgi:hypothetical protein
MDDSFLNEVKLKSAEELKDIAVNFNIYRGALVAAAKQELSNRGIELSEEEKLKIEELKNKRKQAAFENVNSNRTWHLFNTNWKLNIVADVNAPQLYSRQVINIFSILFSVLFGGVLLAINLKTVNHKKAILPVLIYSIGYNVLMIYVINYMINSIPASRTGLTLVFNMLGAIILYNFFWGRYIGKDFRYRTKPFWIPLLIGILIIAFITWGMLAGYKN